MASTASPTSPPQQQPPAPPDPARRNRLITIAASVIILLGGLGMFAVMTGGDDAPRLNDNAVALTKYIGTKAFEQLPFEQQRQYYKVLDNRDDELDQAYAAKRLTESEYRVGLEAAWLGKHINRTEKYFALPPGQARTTYLNKLSDKKERKKEREKKATPNAGAPPDIDADETAAELKVEKWPPAVRSQWTIFHDAYRAQRKLNEKNESREVPTQQQQQTRPSGQ